MLTVQSMLLTATLLKTSCLLQPYFDHLSLHACCVRDTLQTSKGCFLFESKCT